MDELVLGGIIAVLSGLPGFAIGLAVLIGKWRPAQVAAARDPERARGVFGVYMLVVDGMVMLLGVGIMTLPVEHIDTLAGWGAASIVTVSLLGLVPLFRAMQA